METVLRVTLGAGWKLHHLTDRVIELRKDDPTYRKVVGRDGYVRLRAENGMDRSALLNQAIEMAKKCDEELANIVLHQIMPRKVRGYQVRQQGLAFAFGVPDQEPEIIGVRRP